MCPSIQNTHTKIIHLDCKRFLFILTQQSKNCLLSPKYNIFAKPIHLLMLGLTLLFLLYINIHPPPEDNSGYKRSLFGVIA